LLKRQNAPEAARTRFETIFTKILEADRCFSYSESVRATANETKRIREEMRKNGCYTGPETPPREAPPPPDPAALQAELAALEKELAPGLSAETAARFKDFLSLASQRLKEIEAGGEGR
jgi:hypothetical protein